MSQPEAKRAKKDGDDDGEETQIQQLTTAQIMQRLKDENCLLEKDKLLVELNKRFVQAESTITALAGEKAVLNERVVQADNTITALAGEKAVLNEIVVQAESTITLLVEEKEKDSLLKVITETGTKKIPNIQNKGTPTSHLSTSHPDTSAKLKNISLHKVSDIIASDKWGQIKVWLSNRRSELMLRCDKAREVDNALVIETEADVKHYVQLALNDAVDICQKIISITGNKQNEATLQTRQERSVFSNRLDHTVVIDMRSKLPIIAVETKKYFDKAIEKGTPNSVFGQSYDQLIAMNAKGHPSPFAVICCFQYTYITWLDSKEHLTVLASHERKDINRLQEIVGRMPKKESTTSTPSPPTAIAVTTSRSRSRAGFKKTSKYKWPFVRSKSCFQSEHLVNVFVNVIFCALDATFTPRSYMDFDLQSIELNENKNIEIDVIQVKEKTYEWGKLKAEFKGPFHCQQESVKKDLFLVDYIGSGSTSVVYRALTMDGYDCVVKFLVISEEEDDIVKTDEHIAKGESLHMINKNSKLKVLQEVEAYKSVYGAELDGYVWSQTLNNLDCVIMPFFKPIEKNRYEEVLSEVTNRLNLFKNAQLVHDESDQRWRHVGSFDKKIYLFDLGNLKKIDDEDILSSEINDYVAKLKSRASFDANAETTDVPSTPPTES